MTVQATAVSTAANQVTLPKTAEHLVVKTKTEVVVPHVAVILPKSNATTATKPVTLLDHAQSP